MLKRNEEKRGEKMLVKIENDTRTLGLLVPLDKRRRVRDARLCWLEHAAGLGIVHEPSPVLVLAKRLQARHQDTDRVPPTDGVMCPGQVLSEPAVAAVLDPGHALMVQLADRLKDLLVPGEDG